MASSICCPAWKFPKGVGVRFNTGKILMKLV